MTDQTTIYLVDDDSAVRNGLAMQLESAGYAVISFASAIQFLSALPTVSNSCLILDIRMPDMEGPELQKELVRLQNKLPIIFLTGHGNIPLAVKSIQSGAVDFLTKPVEGQALLDSIRKALRINAQQQEAAAQQEACTRLESLTGREREVLDLSIEGLPNKLIAKRLAISPRTVEHHRSHILQKTHTDNMLELVNIVNRCR